MDIGRSIQYVFQDPDWIKKVLIGGLLAIIPIIGWAIVSGFFIRTVRTIQHGTDTPLPEWDQFGDDFVRGLKLLIVMIVWLAPLWIISICAAVLGGIDDTGFNPAGLALNCVGFLYSVAFYFIYPIIIGKFARNEEIGDAFQIGEILQIAQRIPSQLLIFVVLYFVVSFVAAFGVILCFIGIFFTYFIAYLIWGHMIAQISNMTGEGPGPSDPVDAPTAA